MRNLKLIFGMWMIMAFIISCSNRDKPSEESVVVLPKTVDSVAELPVIKTEERDSDISIVGCYVGDFVALKMDDHKSPMNENRINISIDSIDDHRVFGHSVVAGNSRSFKGSLLQDGRSYTISVEEPGDNPYDGVFHGVIYSEKGRMDGTWKANDQTLAVTERKYTLVKKEFKYDPHQDLLLESDVPIYHTFSNDENEAEFVTKDAGSVNASIEILTKKQVENLYKRDLEVMRNAIYARHGYSFKNREMRNFFDHEVSWYIPVSVDVSKDLTEIEKKNIDLIKRYEKHATSYYDSFGR